MIPKGWKLVPVEPTEGMREAGAVRAGTFYDSLPCSVYEAMLAAAPTPPVAVLQLETQLSENDIKKLSDYIARIKAPSAQNYEEQPDGTITPFDPSDSGIGVLTPPAQVVEACVEPYKSHQCLDCGKVIEPTPPAKPTCASELFKEAVLRLDADAGPLEYFEAGLAKGMEFISPPVQEAEPVATVYHYAGQVCVGGDLSGLKDGTRLYTHAPSAKLRQAAGAVVDSHDMEDGHLEEAIERLNEVLENLSAELGKK